MTTTDSPEPPLRRSRPNTESLLMDQPTQSTIAPPRYGPRRPGARDSRSATIRPAQVPDWRPRPSPTTSSAGRVRTLRWIRPLPQRFPRRNHTQHNAWTPAASARDHQTTPLSRDALARARESVRPISEIRESLLLQQRCDLAPSAQRVDPEDPIARNQLPPVAGSGAAEFVPPDTVTLPVHEQEKVPSLRRLLYLLRPCAASSRSSSSASAPSMIGKGMAR